MENGSVMTHPLLLSSLIAFTLLPSSSGKFAVSDVVNMNFFKATELKFG